MRSCILFSHNHHGFYHFFQLFSVQKAILILVEHFKADWNTNRVHTLYTNVNRTQNKKGETENLFVKKIGSQGNDVEIGALGVMWPIPWWNGMNLNLWPLSPNRQKDLWEEKEENSHFCRSVWGPLQQADIPHAISLKSIWLSRFSSNALNTPKNI